MLSGRRLAEQQQIFLCDSFKGTVYHSKVKCFTMLGKALQSLYIFSYQRLVFIYINSTDRYTDASTGIRALYVFLCNRKPPGVSSLR